MPDSEIIGISKNPTQRTPRFPDISETLQSISTWYLNPHQNPESCLHGFRTSGSIMKKQVVGKWPQSVTSKLDLYFANAPFPCQGKSDVDAIFDPPYYEWFQFNQGFTEYLNFDECLDYIEELIVKHGPFDGLMGFSRGVALTTLQAYVCIFFGYAEKAYSDPIDILSLHFIGEHDFLKEPGLHLIDSCVDPVVIKHPKGNTVPRLDEKSEKQMLNFIDKLQKIIASSPSMEVQVTRTSSVDVIDDNATL